MRSWRRGTGSEQRRLQRLREYFEEERRLTTVLNDSSSERGLAKELEDLKKPPPAPPEPLKKPTTRGRSEKQKLRETAHKRYERETTRIEAMKATAKLKASLTKAAANELEEEMVEIENMP